MVLPDGTEIESTWEYGIKLDVFGEFIHLGYMGLPVECVEDLNDPMLYDAAVKAAKEMILSSMLFTIRPVEDEEVDLE
jgi:hypothetical protein